MIFFFFFWNGIRLVQSKKEEKGKQLKYEGEK